MNTHTGYQGDRGCPETDQLFELSWERGAPLRNRFLPTKRRRTRPTKKLMCLG
jgi:hypothetical protein